MAQNMQGAHTAYLRTPWGKAWKPGMVRWNRHLGFYILPRWVDSLGRRTSQIACRLARRCGECHMRGAHKMGCGRR